MNKLSALCFFISSTAVWGSDQYCYECSSKSALCRYSVYDGQYLSRTPCASSCFLRTEGNTIYRGCFDGWLSGIVKYNYVGCRTQEYLGEKVEWCFCKSENDEKSYDQPCNGASRDALSKMALPYEEETGQQVELNEIKDKTLEYEPDENTKYFIPTDSKRYTSEDKVKTENVVTYDIQYEDNTDNIVLNDEYVLNMADKTEGIKEEQPKTEEVKEQQPTEKVFIADDTEGIEICISQPDDPVVASVKPDEAEIIDGSLNDMSTVERQPKETVQCYACHDSSPYCKTRVTKSTYLTVTHCKTRCFIRMEGHKIYRGCFDGWRSSAVESDYTGCRQQFYLGQLVEWCFCKNDLCNRVSIYELGYSGNIQLSNSGKVHHIAYGSLQDKTYSTNNLDDEAAESDTIHPTPEAILRTESKAQSRVPTDLPLSGTVIGMCRKHRDGIYADPFDCARFVHCFSGFTYRRHCPEGTIWNDKRKNCDYYYSDGNNCLLRGYKSKGFTTHEKTYTVY